MPLWLTIAAQLLGILLVSFAAFTLFGQVAGGAVIVVGLALSYWSINKLHGDEGKR